MVTSQKGHHSAIFGYVIKGAPLYHIWLRHKRGTTLPYLVTSQKGHHSAIFGYVTKGAPLILQSSAHLSTETAPSLLFAIFLGPSCSSTDVCKRLSEFCVVVVVVAFSARARILGECSTIHSPPAFFCFFVLKWRLARANYFHCLGRDQSTVAWRAETTVTECSLTNCV